MNPLKTRLAQGIGLFLLILCSLSLPQALLWAADDAPLPSATLGPRHYRFGVFPYLSAPRLETIYAPASAQLSQSTGLTIHFRTASNFERFFSKLSAGHYDLALIQPFWYPPAADTFGYLPLVRMQEPFTSLIMVPQDSPLRTPDDLAGKVIATPPAFVPVVHMARRTLTDLGLTPGERVTLRPFKSVDSCFQQVFIGKAAACVSPPFAPAVVEEKMHVKLRTLLESPAIPNLTVIVHGRVPVEDRERVKQTLLSWSHDPQGRRLLAAMQTTALVPADDGEYDVVREYLGSLQETRP